MRCDEVKEKFEKSFYVVHNNSIIPNRGFHCHDEFEITFFCDDIKDVYYINNGQQIRIQKNSLIFFHNMDIHMLQKDVPGTCERCSVHFKPDLVAPFCTKHTDLLAMFHARLFNPNACNFFTLDNTQAEKYRRIFDDLDESRNRSNVETYGSDVCAVIRLVEILMMLNPVYFEKCGEYGGTQKDVKFSKEKYELLCKVMDFVKENYADELNLDILSMKFYTSKSQLNLIFRQSIGVTPTEYISNYRISRAKELLLKGMQVADVCFRCGYNDPSHFSHAFRKNEGISPKQYQRSMCTH